MRFVGIVLILIILLGAGVWVLHNRTVAPSLVVTPISSIIPSTNTQPKATQAPFTLQVLHSVPFAAQAPFGDWSDPRQQDGCEEASAMMAMRWVKGETFASKEAIRDEILKISHFEEDKYGEFHDTSVQDTADWILKDYFNFSNYEIKTVADSDSMVSEIKDGNILIIPADGKALKNPNFSNGGPDRHMLVVIGYNTLTKQFITNDPGTRQGEKYRYSEKILFNALRNYQTGHHAPIDNPQKLMIVVKK